jgi:hypothetical protein
MRQLLIVVGLCLSAAACGGGGSPTAPTPPPPPPPPPAPVYPAMMGTWAGTLTIVASIPGQPALSNTCQLSWILSAQTQGQFSGTFQTSGGTTSTCGQAGTFSGTVSPTGQISGLTNDVGVGSTNCSRLSGDGIYAGILSNNLLSATTNDRVRCTSGSTSLEASRNLTISAQKQ